MKILFLVNRFPKVSETFILNQVIGLHNLGVNLDILAFDTANEDIRHSQLNDIEISNKLYYLDKHGSFTDRIYSTIKILAQSIGKDLYKYSNSIKAASCQDILVTNKFLSLVKNYDIIHAHFGNMGIAAAKLKKHNITDAKVVTSFYGYDTSYHGIINDKSFYKLLINHGDLNLSLSDFMKSQLVGMGFDAANISVHRLGVDVDKFKVTDNKITSKIRVLSIARLVEKKGLEYSIRAFRKIIDNFKKIGVEYNIIGDGELKDHYQKLINQLSLQNNVFLRGSKMQEEIINYIKDSHLYILPSVTSSNGDMEGTPVSIMEAMASGLPVISTYHSGIPELIEDGKTGFLVPEKNTEQLADKLLYVISNPAILSQISSNARLFIEKHHNISQLNKNLVKVYENLLTKKQHEISSS